MKKNNNLRISRGLKFRIHIDGKIYGQLSSSSDEFYIAPEIFAILVYFSNLEKSLEYPIGLDASLKLLPAFLKKYFQDILKNLPDQNQCKEIVADLIASGFLWEDKKNTDRAMQNDGFGDPWIQWAMISDVQRSMSYEKALAQKITKDSIVLDIGSGTGFLSACALSQGAKKVYAIEESNISKSIEPNLKHLNLIAKSGAIKNFILHSNNTYDVDFAADINLAVSELFGNDPFQEGMFLTLSDAVKRIQNKKVEFIPKKLAVYGEVIDILNHTTKPRIQMYQNDSTIKSTEHHIPHSPFYTKFMATIKSVLPFDGISFPIHFTQKDFERASSVVRMGECSLNPIETNETKFAKLFTGEKSLKLKEKTIDTAVFIFWFRAWLTDNIAISSHPQEADYACHWSPIAVVLNKKTNQKAELKVKYNLAPNNIALECQIFENGTLIGRRM